MERVVTVKKALISSILVIFLLVIGGCNEKPDESQLKDVIVELDFYFNNKKGTLELEKESIMPIDIENLLVAPVSATLTSSDGGTINLKDHGKALLLSFDNAKPIIHNVDGYETEIYFYPVEIKFQNVTDVAKKLKSHTADTVLVDFYNGKIQQGVVQPENGPNTLSEDDIRSAILNQVYQFKEGALEDQNIIGHISNASSAENQTIIAKESLQYMRNTFKYDDTSFPKDELTDDIKGVTDFAGEMNGTCQQFAMMYKLIMDSNGIENRLVYGNFRGTEGLVNHVWNEVYIDGEWIPVDSTGNGFGNEGNYEDYITVFTTNL